MKKQNGISLIVLIVTIIVVIILAAVVILTLSKNNPIESAKEASFKEDVRTFQDELAMYISKDYTSKSGQRDEKITAVQFDKIKKYIPSFNEKYKKKFVIKEDNLVYNEDKITESEKRYVDNLHIEANIKCSAEIIEDNCKSMYGEKVFYKTGNISIDSDITCWKIFYSDGINIYLISDDYVSPALLPEKDGAKPDQGDPDNYPRAARFNNVISKYNGSSDITDERMKELNADYFSKNYTSELVNMKAVAYMLDKDIWCDFVNSTIVEYAVGGPSVEMLFKSYSAKYDVDYRAQAVNNTGYKISKDGGQNWLNNAGNMFNVNDNTYVLPSTSEASFMWLASTYSAHAQYVLTVGSNGSLNDHRYHYTNVGFRPLVCLKSDVILKEVEGGFEIE